MFATRTLAALFATALTAAAATAQTAPKADLIIQDITFDSSDNEVKLVIKNIGGVRAPASNTRLEIVARVNVQTIQEVSGFGIVASKQLFDQVKPVGEIGPGDDKKAEYAVNFASIQAQAAAFKTQLLAQVDQKVPALQRQRVKKLVRDNFEVITIGTADRGNQIDELTNTNNRRFETFPTN